MIFTAMALSVATLGLSDLPPQKLEAGQCVTMLWSKGQPPIRIAMVDEKAQALQLQRNRRTVSLPATGPASYAGEGLAVTLDLSFRQTDAISNGAVVETGSMEITDASGEALILPVGGMRACR